MILNIVSLIIDITVSLFIFNVVSYFQPYKLSEFKLDIRLAITGMFLISIANITDIQFILIFGKVLVFVAALDVFMSYYAEPTWVEQNYLTPPLFAPTVKDISMRDILNNKKAQADRDQAIERMRKEKIIPWIEKEQAKKEKEK